MTDDEDILGPADNTVIDGYRLVLTSLACPEQYDVFDGDTQVGYLRLRGGWFRADAPNHGGETVYESYPNGDGMFDDDERLPELRRAVAAIKEYHSRGGRNAQEVKKPVHDD